MKVLFISSEADPFVKTGGLADVSSALPKALKSKGVDVRLVLPLYAKIDREKFGLKFKLGPSCVHMGNCEEWFAVYESTLDGVPVYFVDFEKYFARSGVYDTPAGEYGDNAYRYSFFSKAALQVARDIEFKPDIVHCNDWQTGLVPYYLKTEGCPHYFGTKSVFTIHNIGYQGVFGSDVLDYAAIWPEHFNDSGLESLGAVNYLKAGLLFADKITTVSPKYAEEIKDPVGSGGMHEILRERSADLIGILNGVDLTDWNPATDKYIPYNYDKENLSGKLSNKSVLQKKFLLEENPDIPVFGFVGRFAHQKGPGLLAGAIQKCLSQMVCQFVIVGSGETEFEGYFGELPKAYPGKVGSFIGYSNEMAHLVEAGSDFFVMPSLYEPCGLNQMYSMVYGTLPVVRATGGLDDTVIQYNESTGEGTGFKFNQISADALANTIGWAVSTYFDRPEHIKSMVENSMKRDFSWNRSAGEYISLYDMLKALSRAR